MIDFFIQIIYTIHKVWQNCENIDVIRGTIVHQTFYKKLSFDSFFLY